MALVFEAGQSLIPVTPSTLPPVAGPALPVVGYPSQPAGRAVESGPAVPVYLVGAAELGVIGLQAGPAVPMVLASAVGVTVARGQRPVPIYLVSGSLTPAPMTIDGGTPSTTGPAAIDGGIPSATGPAAIDGGTP